MQAVDTDRTKALCAALEADMALIAERVRKDLIRERRCRKSATGGLAELIRHRDFILSKDPSYKITVKMPRMPKVQEAGPDGYGHYTRLARKILQELKRGSFAELKAEALKRGLMTMADVEPVRQALYSLKRKGLVGFEYEEDGGGVFSVLVQNSKRAEALSPSTGTSP